MLPSPQKRPVRHVRVPFASSFVIPGAVALCGLLASCGGGGGGGGGGSSGGGQQAPGSLDESLERLGIDTQPTPRLDEQGQTLPEDFAPVGMRWKMTRPAELFAAGLDLQAVSSKATTFEDFENLVLNGGTLTPTVLDTDVGTGYAAMSEKVADPRVYETKRAICGADLDGDGHDERVVALWQAGLVRILVTGDALTSFAENFDDVDFVQGVTSVSLASGDVDADGKDELVLGLCSPSGTKLAFVKSTTNGLAIDKSLDQTLASTLVNASPSLVIECGNLDHDPGLETVVVLNEWKSNATTAKYFVFDDGNANAAQVQSGAITATDPNGVVRTAVVADVSLGDVDGDNVDEALFGGLWQQPQNDCSPSHYVVTAFDDLASGWSTIGGKTYDYFWSGCDDAFPYQMRWVHVDTLDLDGDRRAEVLVNNLAFEVDFASGLAPWTQVLALPDSTIFTSSSGMTTYDRSTSALVVGDVDADGLDDIATYRQLDLGARVFVTRLVAGSGGVQPSTKFAGFLKTNEPAFTGATNPVLLALDVDDDSVTLARTKATHQLVFTEPVVIAVLAAPPSGKNIGQNTLACSTSFGSTNTQVQDKERSVTVTAAAHVGFSIDVGFVVQLAAAEVTATVSSAVTDIVTESYEVSRTLLFTSGPEEDTVVFSCVPMDRYAYQVLTHPSPELVGHEVVVSLPRQPIVVQTERSFYNANIAAGSPQIGTSVFQHTIGDPQSYPTLADKNQALVQQGGLAVGPHQVGQGGGFDTLILSVGQSVGSGGSLEIGFELDVRVTVGGVMTGFSVGSATTDTLMVTSGSATEYSGSVGHIDALHWAQSTYAWGLYTYVQHDSATGQAFEVVNYWVQ